MSTRVRWAIAVIATTTASALVGSVAAVAAPLALPPTTIVAAAAGSDGLASGETLAPGESLLSADERFALVMQEDGNVVVYRPDGYPVWDAGTNGNPGSSLVMQTDGNLVVVAPDGMPLWNSGSFNSAGARLVMQTDGNVVVYDGSYAVWDSFQHPPAVVYPWLYTLFPGEYLAPNDELGDGVHRAVMQSDGDLVLYLSDQALWSSGTYGHPGAYLAMQEDGNLVIYSADDVPLWNTRTAGQGLSELVVQADLNMVVYRIDGVPTWWRWRDTSALL